MVETSGLQIEFVPIRTEKDRLLLGMAANNIMWMIIEIVCKMRGLEEGAEYEYNRIIFDRVDNPGPGDLAGLGFLQKTGSAG